MSSAILWSENALRTLLIVHIFVLSSGVVSEEIVVTNKTISQNSDSYLVENQKECFVSRKLLSCIKYRAAKAVWSLATNRLNYFDIENSKSYVNYGSESANSSRNFRLRFVYLNEPSDLELFEETRSFSGEGELSQAWKFLKRAVQTFAQRHGIQLSLNNLSGFQIAHGGKKFIADSRGHHHVKHEVKKKLKFAILLPIIILFKIAHLKFTVLPLLLIINGLNLLLIAGGTYILYYLKHHTICKIRPHQVETHTHHVWEQSPESRGHHQKHTKKKLKWLIIFPLMILMKIASLKMTMVVLLLGIIGTQLALAAGGAFVLYWLKHNVLCKVNPKWTDPHSRDWDDNTGGGEYSSFNYHGGSGPSYSKDWASSKAYNAYNYLDTISHPL